MIMMKKFKVTDVWHYLVGNVRYWLYYEGYRWLLPKHIVEQYEWRVRVMRKECYDRGECVECGCVTTKLQFADKACAGSCYPVMMGRGEWNRYKEEHKIGYGDIG